MSDQEDEANKFNEQSMQKNSDQNDSIDDNPSKVLVSENNSIAGGSSKQGGGQIFIKKMSARIQNSSNQKKNYRKEEIIGRDQASPILRKKKSIQNSKQQKNSDSVNNSMNGKKVNSLKNSKLSQQEIEKNQEAREKEEMEQKKEAQKIHRKNLREKLKQKKKIAKAERKIEKQKEKEALRLNQVTKQSLAFDASNLILASNPENSRKKDFQKNLKLFQKTGGKIGKKLQMQQQQQSLLEQQQGNGIQDNFDMQQQQQLDNNFQQIGEQYEDGNENIIQPMQVQGDQNTIIAQQSQMLDTSLNGQSQILQDKKQLPALRRKPLANRKLFNPALFQEHLEQKQQIQQKLDDFHEIHGKFMEKKDEPTVIQTHWDYVLKEMQEVQEYMVKRKSYMQFQLKKMSKHSITMLNNIKSLKQQKLKQEEQRIKRVARDMSQMVQRGFWNNVKKVQRFQHQLEDQRNDKEEKKQKLQNLVSQQLKFTQKFADLINPEAKKEKKEKLKALKSGGEDDEIASSSNSEDSDDDNSSSDEEEEIIINLSKTGEKTYCLDNIKYDKKKTNRYQSLEQLYKFAQDFTTDTQKQENQNKIKQPYLLKFNLRSYQLVGMNWLSTLQDKKMNGILADEMGLGKTIQTIAMLANLTCSKGVWGPHLIIVPTSIIINWEIEFKKWCPSFKILTYYGSQRERYLKRQGWSKMNHFQVCITTYKLALQDQKMFKRKKWHYMILDEAQHIKNFKSQRWQVLLNFQTRHRLLLTGTPLQNDVGELWSLLHFLMPKVFDSHSDFMQWFSIPMQQAIQKNLPVSQDILQKLHSILRPFLLRRLKKDVEKQLPTKQEYIIKCPLSRRQKYLYDEFIQRDVTKKSIHQQDFLGLMNIVMQLKKVCNHPDLFEARVIESSFMSQRLHYVVAYHFYFNAYRHNIPNKFLILRHEIEQKNTKYVAERRKEIFWEKNFSHFIKQERQYLQEQEQNQVLIPHFKKRWVNLARQRKFNSLQHVQFYNQKVIYDDSNVMYGYDTLTFLSIRQNPELGLDTFFRPKQQNNEHKYLQMSEYQPEQRFDKLMEEYKFVAHEYMFSQKIFSQAIELVISPYNAHETNKQKNLSTLVQSKYQPIADQYHYYSSRQQLCFPNKKLLMYDCGKLSTMVDLLKKLKDRGDKCLIFTQMSKMLDIFENILNLFNFTYVRLDGSTKIENRQRVVERFNGDPKIFAFISSTRAGGIGINLTAANAVIFYDTDWNPAMDKQAQDRCHRIGQTRNVSIYRLISEATIEENILLKSIQKSKLDQYIMEEGEFNVQMLQEKTFNVKDILGNMVSDNKKLEIDKKDYEKALDQVEDEEDAKATKQAVTEYKSANQQGLNEAAELDKDDKEEEFNVQEDKFPPIFNFGYKFVQHERELDDQTEQEEDDDDDEDEDEDEEEEDIEQSNQNNSNKKKQKKKQKNNVKSDMEQEEQEENDEDQEEEEEDDDYDNDNDDQKGGNMEVEKNKNSKKKRKNSHKSEYNSDQEDEDEEDENRLQNEDNNNSQSDDNDDEEQNQKKVKKNSKKLKNKKNKKSKKNKSRKNKEKQKNQSDSENNNNSDDKSDSEVEEEQNGDTIKYNQKNNGEILESEDDDDGEEKKNQEGDDKKQNEINNEEIEEQEEKSNKNLKKLEMSSKSKKIKKNITPLKEQQQQPQNRRKTRQQLQQEELLQQQQQQKEEQDDVHDLDEDNDDDDQQKGIVIEKEDQKTPQKNSTKKSAQNKQQQQQQDENQEESEQQQQQSNENNDNIINDNEFAELKNMVDGNNINKLEINNTENQENAENNNNSEPKKKITRGKRNSAKSMPLQNFTGRKTRNQIQQEQKLLYDNDDNTNNINITSSNLLNETAEQQQNISTEAQNSKKNSAKKSQKSNNNIEETENNNNKVEEEEICEVEEIINQNSEKEEEEQQQNQGKEQNEDEEKIEQEEDQRDNNSEKGEEEEQEQQQQQKNIKKPLGGKKKKKKKKKRF